MNFFTRDIDTEVGEKKNQKNKTCIFISNDLQIASFSKGLLTLRFLQISVHVNYLQAWYQNSCLNSPFQENRLNIQ